MLREIASAAFALALTSACAAHPGAPSVTPQQAAAIEASCTTIMGLQKGEYQYLACHDNLSNVAAALIQGQARLQAYDRCHGQGMAPGSAALATCMLDSAHARTVKVADSAVAAPVPVPQQDLKAGSSYFAVTHAVQWRREQYSCAQLGLVPGSGAFAHCVAGLDADLQATDQP